MKRLYDNRIWLCLMVLSFFNPTSLKFIPVTVIIYNIIQVIKLGVILLLLFYYFFNRRLSKPFLLGLLYVLTELITTILNGVLTYDVVLEELIILGIIIMTENAIRYNFNNFFYSLYLVLSILTVINILTVFIWKNGIPYATLYTNVENPLYFLGIDNALIKRYLPVVFCSYHSLFLNNKFKNKGLMSIKWSIILNILCFVSLIRAGTSTGIMVYFIVLCLMIVYSLGLKGKVPSKIIILIYIIFFVSVVVLGSQGVITKTIAGIFGKDAGFTGRSLLWIQAIKQIIRRPLIGYGQIGDTISIWGAVFSSHNMFLELLIHGGILLLSVYLYITFSALHNLKKSKFGYYNSVIVMILGYWIDGILEVGIAPYYFIFLVLCFYPNIRYKNSWIVKY